MNSSHMTNSISPLIQERIFKSDPEEYSEILHYEKLRLLSQDDLSETHEIINTESRIMFVCKILPKEILQSKQRHMMKLESEIAIYKSLGNNTNPSIFQLNRTFEDQYNFYMLFEHSSKASIITLKDEMKSCTKMTENQVKSLFLGLINALILLHKNQVIHRDVKLSNIFLSKDLESGEITVKLANFIHATQLKSSNERRKTICGTSNYIAPEILGGNGYSYEVDIWNAGCILYYLLLGRQPFDSKDVRGTYEKIRNNEIEFPEQTAISNQAKNLIVSILNSDPSKRISLSNILLHPFMKEER